MCFDWRNILNKNCFINHVRGKVDNFVFLNPHMYNEDNYTNYDDWNGKTGYQFQDHFLKKDNINYFIHYYVGNLKNIVNIVILLLYYIYIILYIICIIMYIKYIFYKLFIFELKLKIKILLLNYFNNNFAKVFCLCEIFFY